MNVRTLAPTGARSVVTLVPQNEAGHEVAEEERDFYRCYDWCLNPHLTVVAALAHLHSELERLAAASRGWQLDEVANNIFLLSCGLLNCVDEYLRGKTLRLPGRLAATRVGRGAARVVEAVSNRPWSRGRAHVRRWRDGWLPRLDHFLLMMVSGQGPTALVESGRALAASLPAWLPSDLQSQRLGIPSPFSRLDMTGQDVLALGQNLVQRFPERGQPLLLVGLRTSGSYFAPLLKAFLGAEGYRSVTLLTVEPTKGAGPREMRQLKKFAARGFSALLVDDPPNSGSTMMAALDVVRRAGFTLDRTKMLAPAHPAKPDWFKSFPENLVVSLPPKYWHKQKLLDPEAVELRLADYFRGGVRVVASARADEFTAYLDRARSDERSSRLKWVFEVQVNTSRSLNA